MPEVTIEQAMQIAIEHQQAGRIAEAEQICRLILARQPNQVEASELLGIALTQQGNPQAGVEHLRRAAELSPMVADYWSNLGNALRGAGQFEEAVEACRRAVALNPSLGEAQNNLGIALRETGKIDESIEAYRLAIRAKPDLAEAHNNLGNSLTLTHRLDEATAAFREALRIRPDYHEALNNLGTVLADIGKLDEAIASMRQAIRISPKFADAYSNLGLTLSAAGKEEEALVMFRRATVLDPRHAGYHWNLSLELLGQAMFPEGWREFEWRWLWKDFRAPRRSFTQPLWKGEALNGKTILLHFEQGLGDTLQFVRYAPMIRARGARVIIECQKELAPLLRANPELGEIVAYKDPTPPFDVHCPLLTLPLVFKTDLKSIPAQMPYLKADEQLIESWKARLDVSRDQFKVGLVWAGSSTHTRDHHRSMTLEKLLPLAQTPGVVFVSLQKGDASNQAKTLSSQFKLLDFTSDLHDFAQTAALVANLDLVIGVDTAVMHLAAAMRKAAWVLLPLASDWRWLRARADSPWYPTMRLFRQRAVNDWVPVIQRVGAALRSRTS